MQKTMTIGCDIDDVTNQQIEEILKLYNHKYDDTIEHKDITDWEIQRFLKPECKNIFEEFCTEEFIEGLQMSQETIDVLTKLNSEYELYFCTARHPFVMAATDRWLEKNLPWYKSRQLIRVKTKQLLNFDVLIDDNLSNLQGGKYLKILIDKPWNRQLSLVENIFRVKDITEAYKLINNTMKDKVNICK